tara:strand:+ start:3648 stop:4010 length:363 start_codon:yes stop_codon:yes gene_type:complete
MDINFTGSVIDLITYADDVQLKDGTTVSGYVKTVVASYAGITTIDKNAAGNFMRAVARPVSFDTADPSTKTKAQVVAFDDLTSSWAASLLADYQPNVEGWLTKEIEKQQRVSTSEEKPPW